MSNLTVRKMDCGRLLVAAGYIAAASVILFSTLLLVLSDKPASAGEVSASHVTVRRTGVSSEYFTESSTTTVASPSDMTASTAAKTTTKHKNSDFVRVREYIPDVEVELIYATDGNFTGKVIYDFDDAWLRYGTVKKLSVAQEKFMQKGFCIKIWDAFRPVSAQFKLWKICPDPRYVANPNKCYSSHSRGNTVDVTLVGIDGNDVAMPTGFDDFTRLADRNYSDVKDKTAAANAKLLEKTMSECGFVPYSGEWWHFSDRETYGVAKDFDPD